MKQGNCKSVLGLHVAGARSRGDRQTGALAKAVGCLPTTALVCVDLV